MRAVNAYWMDRPIPVHNFGDWLTPFILLLFGRVAVQTDTTRLLLAGSILSEARCGDTVIGSGSLEQVRVSEGVRVLAARGPHSYPNAPAYGDAGLLVGARVTPRTRRTGTIVIPHWKTPGVNTNEKVVVPTLPAGVVVREINRASLVLSESLHGCVVADALGVPNQRVRLRQDKGWDFHCGDFKWDDYYAGIGHDPEPAYSLSQAADYAKVHAADAQIQTLTSLLEKQL